MLFGAINAAVGAFGVFDIAVSVAGLPSPNYAAHTIVAHLYDYAFIRFEMGYASAVAIILFLITFVARPHLYCGLVYVKRKTTYVPSVKEGTVRTGPGPRPGPGSGVTERLTYRSTKEGK